MPLYDKPVRALMRDMVQDLGLKKGQTLGREQVAEWFERRYPKVKNAAIQAHLVKMSTNATSRIHYNATSEGDSDLFFRLDPAHFRLYEASSDPTPLYKDKKPPVGGNDLEETSKFAYERDLRNFPFKESGHPRTRPRAVRG